MVNFSKIYLGLIFKDRGYFLHMSFVGTMNLSLPILVVFESKEFTKKLILTFLIMPFQYTRLLSIYKVTFWELIFSYVHLLSIITSKHDDAIKKVWIFWKILCIIYVAFSRIYDRSDIRPPMVINVKKAKVG